MANALQPDIVVITGDFISDQGRFAEPVCEILGELKPKIGTFGVLGNHDWWADSDAMKRSCARHGIRLIDNSRVFITADRQVQTTPSPGLCLSGIGDLWTDAIKLESAMEGVTAENEVILLSHNPDAAEELRPGHGSITLMLSGHTHGGQVRLPFLGRPVVPSDYGQKYAYGLVNGPNFKVHITSGVGMAVLPVRLAVPPEIVLFENETGTESP